MREPTEEEWKLMPKLEPWVEKTESTRKPTLTLYVRPRTALFKRLYELVDLDGVVRAVVTHKTWFTSANWHLTVGTAECRATYRNLTASIGDLSGCAQFKYAQTYELRVKIGEITLTEVPHSAVRRFYSPTGHLMLNWKTAWRDSDEAQGFKEQIETFAPQLSVEHIAIMLALNLMATRMYPTRPRIHPNNALLAPDVTLPETEDEGSSLRLVIRTDGGLNAWQRFVETECGDFVAEYASELDKRRIDIRGHVHEVIVDSTERKICIKGPEVTVRGRYDQVIHLEVNGQAFSARESGNGYRIFSKTGGVRYEVWPVWKDSEVHLGISHRIKGFGPGTSAEEACALYFAADIMSGLIYKSHG